MNRLRYQSIKDWKAEQEMVEAAADALEFFLASKKPVYGFHIREMNRLDREMSSRHGHANRRGGVLKIEVA